jgi:geranylgeranyl reductase family protein
VDSVDVAVVGGGPAGSAAAITLARAGIDVAVLDKATFPRDKICGDGLTTGALRLLEELGLDPSTVATWQDVEDCYVASPTGVVRHFPLPRGQGRFAAVAARIDLDAALVDLARKAGASVLDGHGVTGATESDIGVQLDVDGIGPLRARWVIAADGMWSPMRKHLGVAEDGYLGEWHAFRQYLSGVSPDAARNLYVFFEPDILPGYFWSFPLPGGRANIGFGVERGGKVAIGDMKHIWADLLDRPVVRDLLGPDATPDGPHRAWPIPARVDRMIPTTERTLFVGDAVAACDVLTGEGIGQALRSGRRAAEAIRDRGALGDAPQRYAAALHDDLVADHAMSVLLARAMRHRKGARAAVRVAGATAWTRRNFARWLFEDYPRAVVATPRRWHRGVLTGPGAYQGS